MNCSVREGNLLMRGEEEAAGVGDELAAEASPAVRQRMTGIFVRCARMEWLFWDSAYHLEKWKI